MVRKGEGTVTENSGGYYDIRRDVLPIVVTTRHGYPTIKGFMGTGFLVGKGLFVTCHHCVAAPVAEEDTYAVITPIEYAPELRKDVPDASFFVTRFGGLEQDPSGLDLAIGWPGRDPVGLILSGEGVSEMGEDVRTYGYPLTQDMPHPEGAGRSLTIDGRLLKGYITTNYMNEVPSYGPTPTDELDMPAPRGLSSAPIVRASSREVIGVVYGTKDTGTVEEFSRVDEETGERTPELERVTANVVTHMLDSLHNLSGEVTHGMPLIEYLRA
jgi:hypothetical protein